MKRILFFTVVFSVLCIGIFGEVDSMSSEASQFKGYNSMESFNNNGEYSTYNDTYEFTYSMATYKLESYLNYDENWDYELKDEVNNGYIIEAKFTGKSKLKKDCTYYVSENRIEVYE